LGTEPGPLNEPEENWPLNYFNYFTEVEEHFQRARGTALFLLSPVDWALIETWKNSGVPLEAVLRGIDQAFEKWRARKSKIRMINSLAYCTQAVLEQAQRMAGLGRDNPKEQPAPPFGKGELEQHLKRCAAELRAKSDPALVPIAEAVEALAAEAETYLSDLEELERRLTALEEKMVAIARSRQSDEDSVAARREMDAALRPYRSKMPAAQLAMLEQQYLERRLLEKEGLPRLSLFYLR
jgi:hypothetical protein